MYGTEYPLEILTEQNHSERNDNSVKFLSDAEYPRLIAKHCN